MFGVFLNLKMITIKMYKEKWRININEEDFEFENREDFDACLKVILDLKDKFGRIKDR